MMKKITKCLICSVLAFSAAMPLCSCTGIFSNESQTEEYNGFLWNGGDRSKNISLMKMDERKALVKDYLDYIGFDYGEYELSDVYQYSNGSFSAESAYHCNVYKVKEDSFTVWLENDGKAIDDRFMDDLEPLIQDDIAENISAVYPKSETNIHIGMHRKPLKEWTSADGAENFLKSDEDYVISIYVVLDADSELTQEEAEETMKNRLDFLKSADFFFFKEEKQNEVNLEELDWSEADIKFTQQRENR